MIIWRNNINASWGPRNHSKSTLGVNLCFKKLELHNCDYTILCYIQTIEYYVIVEGGKREPIAKRTKGTNQPSTGVALSLYYTVFQITWCHGKYFVPTKKPVTREN